MESRWSLLESGTLDIEVKEIMLDNTAIRKVLPHRYPFLLLDEVIEHEHGSRVVGIKSITGNDFFNQEPYCQEEYVFSGVLQIEAMAQVAGIIIRDLVPDDSCFFLLAAISEARFRKVVRPGDQLRMELKLEKYRSTTAKFQATSYVGEELVGEAKLTCMIEN